MSSRGRGSWRGRRSNRNHGNHPTHLKGLFAQNIWHCDCNPRLPADNFQVKKEGGNKGRWFYTCQNKHGETSGCGFFLWDDDAKIREESAVLSNSREEARPIHDARSAPPPASPTPPHRPQGDSGQRAPSAEPPSSPRTLKGADSVHPDFAMASDEEDLTTTTAATAVRNAAPATPAKRKHAEVNGAGGGLPTPKTGGRAFASPGRAGPLSAAFLDMVSPATTPTAGRGQGAGGGPDALYEEVVGALRAKGVGVGEEARAAVRDVCAVFARRALGVEKGKEISQLALRARDAKIEELKRRIGTLEAELETERAVVQHLRWEMEAQERE